MTDRKEKKSGKNTIAKKAVKFFWITFIASILVAVLFFYFIAQGKIGYMPPIEDLENPISKYASQIISVDKKNIGTYALEKGNRIYVDYKELSPNLVNALIATEDERFLKHSGIDAYALARAIIKTGILFQKNAGGASTISQQLAKQLYSGHAKTIVERLFQKPIEWVIAVQLERYYTKQEIINMYLNQFDFLYNAVGVQSACWVYFGKYPKDVTVEEAATLIGMCKNPSYFNPLRQVERTRGRRNVVLDQMCDNHYITKAERDSLKALPLVTHYNKVDHKEGIAPYFREYLRLTMTAKEPNISDAQYRYNKYKFTEDSIAWENNPLYGWCNKNKKIDGSNYNIASDGLKIYTTIDSRMQTYAEQVVREHMSALQPRFFKEKGKSSTAPYSITETFSKNDMNRLLDRAVTQSDRYRNLKKENNSDSQIRTIFDTPTEMQVFSWEGPKDTILTPRDSIRYMKHFLRTGFMAMDTHSGAVKAYVGGIDYKYFQYDMVNMGKRQVGSTIKPYLYSLAMENGFNPCDEVLLVQPNILAEDGKVWSPRNSNDKRRGEWVSVRWGLQNSDNWVTAYLMKELSPYAFKRLLLSYGLHEPIDAVMALSLGTNDASVSEMASGYSTFANGGIRVEPMFVTRIEDRNGNVIADFTPRMHEVISEDSNYKMLNMLMGVVDEGTGGRLRYRHKLKVPMGGKTGTTQENSDAWFVGFTPSLVGACWVGGEDRSIHFRSMAEGQGAAAALPIIGEFLKKVFADSDLGYSESETFQVPAQYADPCATGGRGREELNISNRGVMDDLFN
ncbi:MAG: transglycosylase domain-containing protein [Dysgonamonadaceae bacterium]|nr:transglycosylase domain-containing protein [Dysgonamonadaceae bacterium]